MLCERRGEEKRERRRSDDWTMTYQRRGVQMIN